MSIFSKKAVHFETIKTSAYLELMVDCEHCNRDLKFAEEPTDPMDDWAERCASFAVANGWG